MNSASQSVATTKAMPNLVSTLLAMAALRAWPSLAATASIPITVADALEREEKFRGVLERLRLSSIPVALAQGLGLRDRAGFFYFLTGLDGENSASYRRKARNGAARFLEPSAALAMALCLRVTESRGGRGLLAWLALADKIAKLLGYAGFHAVASGGKGWQPRKLSRQAGERGLSLKDVLAGKLIAPGDSEPATPAEAVSMDELRPLIDKVRLMQKLFKAGMAFAIASGMAATTPAGSVQAKKPHPEALPATSATPETGDGSDSGALLPVLTDKTAVPVEATPAEDNAKTRTGEHALQDEDTSATMNKDLVQAEANPTAVNATPEIGEEVATADALPALADKATVLAEASPAEDDAKTRTGEDALHAEAPSAAMDNVAVQAEANPTGDDATPETGEEVATADALPALADKAAVPTEASPAEDDATPETGDGSVSDALLPALTDKTAVPAEATSAEDDATTRTGEDALHADDASAAMDKDAVQADANPTAVNATPERGERAVHAEDGHAAGDETAVPAVDGGASGREGTESPEPLEEAGGLPATDCQAEPKPGDLAAPRKRRKHRKHGRRRKAR